MAARTIPPVLGVPFEQLLPLRTALRDVARGADPDDFLTPTEVGTRAAGQRRLEEFFAGRLDRASTGLLAHVAAQRDRIPLPDLLGLAAVGRAGGYGTPVHDRQPTGSRSPTCRWPGARWHAAPGWWR